MSLLTRRHLLLATGVGVAGLGGCLSDTRENPGGGDDSDDSNDDTDDDNDGTDDNDGSDPAVAVYQLGHVDTYPRWEEHLDVPGIVEVFDDANSLFLRLWDLSVGTDDDDDDDVSEKVPSATDTDEYLVFVQTAWSDGCATELVAEDLTVEDGTLTGHIEPQYVEDDPGDCPAVISYPSLAIHVQDTEFEDVSLEVTDGWDATGEVTPADWSMDPVDLPGHVSPEGDPPAVPEPLSCPDEDFERLWTRDNPVELGEVTDSKERVIWALRARHAENDIEDAPLAFERGDVIEIELRNVTPFTADTGNSRKVSIEVQTADGWQDVRGFTEGAFGWTDEAIIHEPGDGFTWEIELTEDGIVDGDHGLEVCPDLQSGRYRFRVWDILGTDADIGVEFDFLD